MGKKNLMMIMMVALVTMLLMIMPVSAFTPVAKNIGPGSTIFIGEEGLDITSAMNGYDTIGYWASGASCTSDGSANTIQVYSRKTSFSVTPSEFSTYTGTWYQVDGNVCKDVAFYVRDPSISMSIMTDKDENVGGKTVAAGTNLTFEINSNVYIDGKRGDVLTTVVSPIVEQFNVSTSSTGAVEFSPVISAGTPPFKYLWEFGDGTNSTLENPTHMYSTTGDHIVTLTVFNNPTTGISSKASAIVTTHSATYLTSLTNFHVINIPSDSGAPVANFTTSINSATGEITFTDASTIGVPNAMVLSLGDGSISTLMPYSYTYSPIVSSHVVTYEAYDTSINSTHSKMNATVIIAATYDTSVSTFTKTPPSKLNVVSYTTDQSKGYAKVVVKTESGGIYDRLVTSVTGMVSKPLDNIYLTTSETLWESGTSFWATNAKDGSGNRVYQSGVYAVYAECDLNGMKENYKNDGSYYTGKTVSTVSSVTIGSDSLKITANKESVVRGKDFSLTVIGTSNTAYTLIMKGVSSLSDSEKPLLVEFQEGVTKINATYATITTGSVGTRTVGFTTSGTTKDQKYTFKVQSAVNAQKYDEVTVNVVKGGLTLVASGDQSYFLGEEIKLSGTNSESDTTYFFIVGPNLNSNGASLDGSGDAIINDVDSTFVSADVDSSDVFTYDWSTSMADLDSGTYTIYGVSKPKDKSHISDAAYATVSVIIKKPYVSATSKGTVAKGDKIFITGVAEGQPSSGVAVWVLGKNYATINTQSIDIDGTFEYEIPGADTNTMSSGQYFVVVQHPMQNDKFDIVPTNYNLRTSGDVFIENLQLSDGMIIFKIGGSGSLQGSDAAEALVQAISDPNIDDTYTKLTIFVQEPLISINAIGDKHVGDKFTITGKTNLAVDDEILMEVYSSSFKPTQKTQSGEFSGATGTIKVTKGEAGMNEFAFDIDSSTFKTDEYIVMAQAVVQDITGSALFNVVEGASVPVVTPTPVVVVTPAPVVTAIPTVPPTVIPTTIVPTTTSAPGFGAVFALIGLGAVGFIVVRRE